jgi:hypothetical protein
MEGKKDRRSVLQQGITRQSVLMHMVREANKWPASPRISKGKKKKITHKTSKEGVVGITWHRQETNIELRREDGGGYERRIPIISPTYITDHLFVHVWSGA